MKQIVTGLDIGSNSIKVIVSEIYKTKIFVLSCVEVKSKGIKRGVIVDNDSALEGIKKAIQKTEEIIGIKIKRVILSVPSYFLEFLKTKGYISINREENIIDKNDIIEVQRSCLKEMPSNKELVAIMPINYIINDNVIVSNPLNKESAELGIEAMLVTVPKKNIYPVVQILDALEIEVIDFTSGGICDYNEFKSVELDNSICAVVNIGKQKTEVSIFEHGVMSNSCVIELGSRNIDKDISYVFGTSIQDSCKLKENFACANTKNASTNETLDCLTREGEHIKINQYEIAEVVSSRVDEMLELIKSQINLLTKKEINYILITGGGVELKDFDVPLDKFFGKKVYKVVINEIGARNLRFSTCLGLIKYYSNKLNSRGKLANLFEEEEQENMFIDKVDGKEKNGIFSKVHGYFFDD